MTLQGKIEDALRLDRPSAIVERIKKELTESIVRGELKLEPRFHATLPGRYARRLLFANPSMNYTAVVMTWGPGQQTPVHDHAGIWCVEGVLSGEMTVTQYELCDERNGLFQFVTHERVQARVGSAGCLIPPYEHHVLANPTDGTSITLHIYGGEISRCNVYIPRHDGWYERSSRALGYDN